VEEALAHDRKKAYPSPPQALLLRLGFGGYVSYG
jgi:hypothetical protein